MATAAPLEESVQSASIFDCPICLEKFKAPVDLPCQHTFCSACLETFVESMVGEIHNKSRFCSCPVCRVPFSVDPQKKVQIHFPVNELMVSLMSVADKTVDKIFQNLCDPCSRIGNNIKADVWCCDCDEAYCLSCLHNFHKRVENSITHTVTDVCKVGTQFPKLITSQVEQTCFKHHGKPLEMICVDHSQLCCVICLVEKHRTCENLKPIDEALTDFQANHVGHDFIMDFQDISSEINKLTISKKEQLLKMQDQKDKLISDATKVIDASIQKLEQIKREVKDKVFKKFTSESKSLQLQIETLSYLRSNILQNISLLQALHGWGHSRQVFFLLQRIKPDLETQRKFLESDSFSDETIEFQWNINPNIIALATKTEKSFKIISKRTLLPKNRTTISIVNKLGAFNDRFQEMFISKHKDRGHFVQYEQFQHGNHGSCLNTSDDPDSDCDETEYDCMMTSLPVEWKDFRLKPQKTRHKNGQHMKVQTNLAKQENTKRAKWINFDKSIALGFLVTMHNNDI
ncbi:unnamed protein product [Mytilus coruscus]|uniref:RING-type domain-containing protein n=1 Tax=Mytilus coruscus TaxID=42192 RepID=A0A6J8CCV9_MYTCO|nr:unnamed protein product [Mytilus coruscus]